MTDIADRDTLWDEFHTVVNMTSSELRDWLQTQSAGEARRRCQRRQVTTPGSASWRSSASASRTSLQTTSE